jgi:hypothetical protein
VWDVRGMPFPSPRMDRSGLEQSATSTPSLPCAPIGNRWQPTATVLACFGRFGAVPFATGCDPLRPLCSINAPYVGVHGGNARRVRPQLFAADGGGFGPLNGERCDPRRCRGRLVGSRSRRISVGSNVVLRAAQSRPRVATPVSVDVSEPFGGHRTLLGRRR